MPGKMEPNWKKINEANSEGHRKQLAQEKGLPEDASWEEISKAE